MNIYIIKNFTLRELYLGATEGSSHETVKAHKANPDSPVSHWKWGVEQIRWGEVQAGLPTGAGLSYLAALRKEPLDEGWVQVFGGDDLLPPADDPDEEEWLPPPED